MLCEEVLNGVLVGRQIVEVLVRQNELLLRALPLIPVGACGTLHLVERRVRVDLERLEVAALVQEVVVNLLLFILARCDLGRVLRKGLEVVLGRLLHCRLY